MFLSQLSLRSRRVKKRWIRQNRRIELSAPDRERKQYRRTNKGFSGFMSMLLRRMSDKIQFPSFGFQTVQLKILAESHSHFWFPLLGGPLRISSTIPLAIVILEIDGESL